MEYEGISGYKAIWLAMKVKVDEARDSGATPKRIAELEGCVESFREKGEAGEPFIIPKDVQRMFERAYRDSTDDAGE